MYAVGSGVPKDFAVAETWFSLAGERDAEMQFFIGGMYYLGDQEGVPQDYAKAAAWIRLAAEQGDAHSQFVLGGMYEKGEGVPQDDAEAVAWFRLAAALLHESSLARTMPTDRILTCRCDTTLVGRGRSSG